MSDYFESERPLPRCITDITAAELDALTKGVKLQRFTEGSGDIEFVDYPDEPNCVRIKAPLAEIGRILWFLKSAKAEANVRNTLGEPIPVSVTVETSIRPGVGRICGNVPDLFGGLNPSEETGNVDTLELIFTVGQVYHVTDDDSYELTLYVTEALGLDYFNYFSSGSVEIVVFLSSTAEYENFDLQFLGYPMRLRCCRDLYVSVNTPRDVTDPVFEDYPPLPA